MRRALSLSLFLAASPLFAAIEFFPPMADSHTAVQVRFQSTRFCGAVGHAAITGSTITLTSTPRPHTSCGSSADPAIADLGVLPAGVYDVRSEANEHATLIVRDATSGLFVSPVGVSTTAGRVVQICTGSQFAAGVSSVTFGGAPATIQVTGLQCLLVTPPPHDPGTVDVIVTDEEGSTKSVAAFTYFDPAAPVDPQLFEPVLYPVAYFGPGVFGSQWRTENEIGTGNAVVRFKDLQQVEACYGGCGGINWSGLLSRASSSGVLVWVVRRRLPPVSIGNAIDDDFRVASRIIEMSRPDSVNATLPVARERDFRQTFTIDRIPLGPDARVTLRLYSTAQTPVTASVTLDRAGLVSTQLVTLTPTNGVDFAALDVPPSPVGARTQPLTVHVSSLEKVWGLVTLTDNGTQQVTAFSSQ